MAFFLHCVSALTVSTLHDTNMLQNEKIYIGKLWDTFTYESRENESTNEKQNTLPLYSVKKLHFFLYFGLDQEGFFQLRFGFPCVLFIELKLTGL